MSDVEQLKKELDRLQDLAADMFTEKYGKRAMENHKRIEKIKKQIARLENK